MAQDVRDSAPRAAVPNTRPRLPPQALSIDRSTSSATLTDRSGVEAAKASSLDAWLSLPPWVREFV
jgi:hypothetical protein